MGRSHPADILRRRRRPQTPRAALLSPNPNAADRERRLLATAAASGDRARLERYPFIAALFEFSISHRAALTLDTQLVIVRAARTSQQPHDLEAKYDEPD